MTATREQAQTIGIQDKKDLAVTVKLGTSEAGAIQKCAASKGQPDSAATSVQLPCERPSPTTTPETLYVQVSYQGSVEIPFLPSWSIPLHTTGAYRCEYTQ